MGGRGGLRCTRARCSAGGGPVRVALGAGLVRFHDVSSAQRAKTCPASLRGRRPNRRLRSRQRHHRCVPGRRGASARLRPLALAALRGRRPGLWPAARSGDRSVLPDASCTKAIRARQEGQSASVHVRRRVQLSLRRLHALRGGCLSVSTPRRSVPDRPSPPAGSAGRPLGRHVPDPNLVRLCRRAMPVLQRMRRRPIRSSLIRRKSDRRTPARTDP